jgi:uncharacterized protein (TIGR03437 family)
MNSGQSLSRAPQSGVGFDGTPLNISIGDIEQVAGRRTPDSTVAQRQYRFAIVVIVPQGSTLTTGVTADAVKQVEGYRSLFENFFANAADGRASADTSLRRRAALSLSPAAGVVTGQAGSASITLATLAAAPVTFSLKTPNLVLFVPASVTIPAGATQVSFQTLGVHEGVEEFSAVPSDASYETAVARVQVAAASGLHMEVVTNGPPTAVVRVVDRNELPYSNVPVTADAGGDAPPANLVTDENGSVAVPWPGSASMILRAGPAVLTLQRQVKPVITTGGIVNAASYQPAIAPGSLASIFGANFAGTQPPQILIDGTAVIPFYASATQLNFLAPADLLTGDAQVQVVTPGGASDPVIAQVIPHAPGIFGARQAGNVIEIYCTGLGAVDPTLSAQIAGQSAAILYAGSSSFAGLNQVNVQIPTGVTAGLQPIRLSIDGMESNTINLLLNITI